MFCLLIHHLSTFVSLMDTLLPSFWLLWKCCYANGCVNVYSISYIEFFGVFTHAQKWIISYMMTLWLTFWRTSVRFSLMFASFYVIWTLQRDPIALHPYQHLLTSYCSHPSRFLGVFIRANLFSLHGLNSSMKESWISGLKPEDLIQNFLSCSVRFCLNWHSCKAVGTKTSKEMSVGVFTDES